MRPESNISSNAFSAAPCAARFSVNGHPPRLTDAILLAEVIHAALVKLSDGSSVFTGCDASGQPLKDNSHAYILSESDFCSGRGQDGEITHIAIYAPAGFGPGEVSAIEDLREIYGSGIEVRLSLLGLGQRGDFAGLDSSGCRSSILARSRSWVSRTPFIPTRHPKVTRAGMPKRDERGLQIGSPEHELRRLLELEGIPEPQAVEPVSCTELAGRRTEWSSFRRTRSCGQGRRAGSAGYGFRIEFAEPVQGPVAVGYGAHFGIGVFEMVIPEGLTR